MTWYEYVVGPIGIALTTGVAIYSIRRTVEEMRLSNIHVEMCACLVDTVRVVHESITLLDGIARKACYNKIPEEEFIENAYTRYWREIGKLSDQYKSIQAKQKLIFPSNLYEEINGVIKKLNEARESARYAAPDQNHIYPDTSDLQQAVSNAATAYRNFVNLSRIYLGTDKIKPFAIESELELKDKENQVPSA
jgi:hypothetical protein